MAREINKTTKTDLYKIDPLNIEVPEGFNSRVDFGDIAELAAQIAKDGVINPIHVQRIPNSDKFKLIDGERRYRAVMYNIEHGIDMKNIPAILINMNTETKELIRIQLQSNEGKNFNEYEYGIAYQKLREEGMSNKEIAALVGKQIWHINVCLAHLSRDKHVQDLLKDGRITGVDVRHIYQAHDKESDALEEIKYLEDMADKRGKNERLSLADLKKRVVTEKTKSGTVLNEKAFSKTTVLMDTTAIKNGLNKLFEYISKSCPNTSNFSLQELYKDLQSGMLIDEAIKRQTPEYKESAV